MKSFHDNYGLEYLKYKAVQAQIKAIEAQLA